MAEDKPRVATGWLPFLLLVAVLGFNLYSGLFVTADEYPPRYYQVFEITLDAVLIGVLVALRMQWSRTLPPGDQRRTLGNILFVVALICGLGVLGIRLTSDHAWWTGNLNYSLD